jgi:hypothetical protein
MDLRIIVCALELRIKKHNNAKGNEIEILLLLDGIFQHLNCIIF